MGTLYRVFAWSGMIMIVSMGLFLILFNQFVPPHSPALSADEIAAIYQERANPIRFGSAMIMLFSVLFITWTLAIDALLSRIKGVSSLLLKGQIIGGSMGFIFILLPMLMFAITAFRPERPPELTLLLSDLAWLMLITPAPPFVLQNVCIGTAVLMDRSDTPVFPRWLGYLAFWVAVVTIPALVAFFFRTGPFAWDGLFPFWLPFGIFATWLFIVSLFLVRAPSLDR